MALRRARIERTGTERRMSTILVIIGFSGFLAVGFSVWRVTDRRIDHSVWRELSESADLDPRVFDISMVEDLPEPAQRYCQMSMYGGKKSMQIPLGRSFGLGNLNRRSTLQSLRTVSRRALPYNVGAMRTPTKHIGCNHSVGTYQNFGTSTDLICLHVLRAAI